MSQSSVKLICWDKCQAISEEHNIKQTSKVQTCCHGNALLNKKGISRFVETQKQIGNQGENGEKKVIWDRLFDLHLFYSVSTHVYIAYASLRHLCCGEKGWPEFQSGERCSDFIFNGRTKHIHNLPDK